MTPSSPSLPQDFAALILAGGQGQRMQGRDKGLVELNQRKLIEYPLACLRQLTPTIMISANRNLATYRTFGVPVIRDTHSDYPGPLAGILTGLNASEQPLLTCPCDAPHVTPELFLRLAEALTGNAAVAHDGERLQPTFLALSHDCRASLEQFLARGERKLQFWVNSQEPALVDCSDHPEWFCNVNSPADLAALSQAKPL